MKRRPLSHLIQDLAFAAILGLIGAAILINYL